MAMHAAELYDDHQKCGIQAAAAKYLGAEAGFDACDRAMSTHGGYAYAKEYHVERLWREARLLRNAPLSQEMVLNCISTQALKLPRPTNAATCPPLHKAGEGEPASRR